MSRHNTELEIKPSGRLALFHTHALCFSTRFAFYASLVHNARVCTDVTPLLLCPPPLPFGANLLTSSFSPLQRLMTRHVLCCLLLLGGTSGCIFLESSAPSPSPDADQGGAEMGSTIDMPSDMPSDMSSDMPQPDEEMGESDMSGSACETDEELCRTLILECGELNVVDSCGKGRLLDCGDCDAGQECNRNNICQCVPWSEQELCAQFNTTDKCGPINVRDNCMQPRTISCNACPDGEECNVEGQCVTKCEPRMDAELCMEKELTCGEAEGPFEDGCGNMIEVVTCGVCPPDEVCRDNNCFCEPLGSEALCLQQGKACGTHTLIDNCTVSREVDCGTCPDGDCDFATGTCSVCTSLTDKQFCIQQQVECGEAKGIDDCTNEERIVPSCEQALAQACNQDEICGAGQCECPIPICAPDQCGTISNACGGTAQCGGCDADRVCNANTNTCNCGPALCPVDFECGQYTNSCGNSSGECGECAEDEICQNNQCVCQPETDDELCMDQDAECGNTTAMDRCGTMRTINCGSCNSPETCSMNNECKCIPETPCELCAQNKTSLDCSASSNTTTCREEYTFVDRCGEMREVTCCDDTRFLTLGGCDPVTMMCN